MTTYELSASLPAISLAHRRLEQTLETLTEDEARGASGLPGWTRGHLLTHLARHAESAVRLADGAAANVPAEQYPGGAAERNAGIEAGADRPAKELAVDVAETNAEVERVFAAMPTEAWDRIVTFRQGDFPAARTAWTRWREVEIHHADLALDRFTIADWPAAFVEAHLPHELAKLADRLPAGVAYEINGVRYGDGAPHTVAGPDFALLAWLFGRPDLAAPHLDTPAPDLPNWG